VESPDFEETVDFTGFSAAPVGFNNAADMGTGQDWGVHVHSTGESLHHNARPSAPRVKRRKGRSGWYLGFLALLLLLWVAWLRGYFDANSFESFATWLTETTSSLKGEFAQSPTRSQQDSTGGVDIHGDSATAPAADPVTAPVQVGGTTAGSDSFPELEAGPASEAVTFAEPATRPGSPADSLAEETPASQTPALAPSQTEATDSLDCSLKFRISFDNDSSQLSEDARELLNAVASDCLASGTNEVRVTGYTDNWGGWDYNLRLSRQRAEAAADYLIAQGVSPESVYAEGLGEYGLDQAAAGPEANADDRRIVLVEIMAVESAP
jgi:outer membrane protein OmpA-like peptidoglycan-associated protein